MMEPLNVTLCGGGRTGHLNAVLFKQLPGVRVSLLTGNPEMIESHRESGITALLPDGTTLTAQLDAVSDQPHEVLSDADMVIITVPAQARPSLLRRIAGVLPADKPVYVGAIPGFCGFDWLAEQILAERPNVVIWGMKDVPHTAFDLRPGVSVRMGGAKQKLYVATHERESASARKALLERLQRLYASPVELLGHFLEITLTPGNPIMHPSVVYGLIGPYGQWHGKAFSEPLCWWSDCPELGAYFLERCDEESQLLCREVERRLAVDLSSVKPLKQEIIEAYPEQIRDRSSLLSVLRTNQAYDSIPAPLVRAKGGYLIDKASRAFHEDVAYGLALLVEMGERLGLRLPHMRDVFDWNVTYMGGTCGSALDYFPETWPAPRGDSERNAVRRLVRCMFAEGIIDKDSLVLAPQGHSAWLPLRHRPAMVCFEDLRVESADTVVNRGAITLVENTGRRIPLDNAAQMIDTLRESFGFSPSDEGVADLKDGIANSVANDATARIHRRAWNRELGERIDATGAQGLVDYLRHHADTRTAALLLDQWGSLEGHPFYPTWKAKPGLTPHEVAALSPEYHATVPVRIAALHADHAYVECMPHVQDYPTWFVASFPETWKSWKSGLRAKGLSESGWLPLPIHSWHLENFVSKEYANEIAEGILILDGPDIETRPTMSFRTMLPELPGTPPFIKLPVALWLTSEQRSLQAKSIHMGPRNSTLITRILADEEGFGQTLEIFPEEVALHYKHAVKQEDGPGRYLSAAFRASRNAFDRDDGLLPVTVAALLTDAPSSGRPLITELIEQGGKRPSGEEVETYFRRYTRVVTRPVIALYLLYGIGLEAHQQNSSVLFDAQGTPRRLLIRDFGDGRVFAPLLNARGHQLKPYTHPGILPTVFDDDIGLVRSFVVDACFVCHLHELALLLTGEYDLAPGRLWEILREETESAFDVVVPRIDPGLWRQERAAFLDQAWPTRSVLSMILDKYADYRLEHLLPNPLLPTRAKA